MSRLKFLLPLAALAAIFLPAASADASAGCGLARPTHPACSFKNPPTPNAPRVIRAWVTQGVEGFWTIDCQRASLPEGVHWTRGGTLSPGQRAVRRDFPSDAHDCVFTVYADLKKGAAQGELHWAVRPWPVG